MQSSSSSLHYFGASTIAPAGEVVVPGVVPRLSLTPGKIEHLGPHKGADTERVLSEWLGMDGQEIAELRAREVI